MSKLAPATSPILHACLIGEGGKGTALEGTEIAKKLKAKSLAWVHLDANHPQARSWLMENVSYLDPMILDALLASETRPRMVQVESGVLAILRGVNLNEGARPEDMVSLRMWVDSQRIITLRKRRLMAVQDVRTALENGKGPQDAGSFLSTLLFRLLERMEPVMSRLDDATDALEEQLIDKPDTTFRKQITDIRKKAIMLRRYMAPQRDVVNQLKALDVSWCSALHKRHLQEAADRLTRYVEDLDAIRERAQVIKDELATALSDKLNRNLYMLSVISATFLPLGFLTGLFGINIGGMPGVENAHAFWLFCGVLVVLVLVQIILFKRLKWF